MNIKYTSVFVNDLEEAVGFFTDKLGFSRLKNITADTPYVSVPLRINNTDQYINLVEDKQHYGFKTRVIFNTDDCLKDYHQLKTKGIDFKQQPQYQPVGLSVEFADDYGNEYILLEERNYTDL